MILIYIPKETNRIRYIVEYIFTDLLQTPYKITTDNQEYIKSDLPKVTYGKERLADEFFIPSSELLFETRISKQHIDFSTWNDLPVFFITQNGDLPFDLFAASFFLITRYEEYLPHSTDRHSRYKPEESVAFRGGFLDRPIINLWAEQLKKSLSKKYSQLKFPHPVFSFTPTIDIDNAYAYKYKGVARSGASLLSKLFTFEFKKFGKRLAVHCGFRQDPYDSYDKQERIHRSYNIKPLYFILLGDFSKFDRNLSHSNKYMVSLIKQLGENGTIGLHPSYSSNKSENQLHTEKERLEKITGTDVTKSRQHYIKLTIPKTYRNLIKLGINEDYSMGYPSMPGYRAGTSVPFMFFDLEHNNQTSLKIFPFMAMDSTMKYYQRFKSREVITYLRPMVDELKRVGGNFVFVFHNESIGDGRNWKHWGDIYEKVIKLSMEEIHD